MAIDKIIDSLDSEQKYIFLSFFDESILEKELYIPDDIRDHKKIDVISIREITINKINDKLEFDYANMESTNINYSISELDRLIAEIKNAGYRIPAGEERNSILRASDEHGPTNLNPPSKLAVSVPKNTLMIFVLRGLSNVHFSEKGPVFTADAVQTPKADQRFLNTRKVDSEGNQRTVDKPVKDCRIATMIILPPDEVGGKLEYSDPFNIHLELSDFGGGKPFKIPFIIDPDVRFPGGDGP